MIKYNSREAGQEAENREKQMFEILRRYKSVIYRSRLTEAGQMLRLLYVLLYSLPGGEQGSTTRTFSPAPSAVARGIIHFSASVSPLLPIGHPGPGRIHITNSLSARLQDPQNTRDRLEQAACSALHPSILLSARRTAGEGGTR